MTNNRGETARALAARLCSVSADHDWSVNHERRLQYQARDLDAEIATLVWGEPELSGPRAGPRHLMWCSGGLGREVAPEFTTSLDAALPEENIRRVVRTDDARWDAEALDSTGQGHWSMGSVTEALARRAAALLAWGATR